MTVNQGCPAIGRGPFRNVQCVSQSRTARDPVEATQFDLTQNFVLDQDPSEGNPFLLNGGPYVRFQQMEMQTDDTELDGQTVRVAVKQAVPTVDRTLTVYRSDTHGYRRLQERLQGDRHVMVMGEQFAKWRRYLTPRDGLKVAHCGDAWKEQPGQRVQIGFIPSDNLWSPVGQPTDPFDPGSDSGLGASADDWFPTGSETP